MPGQGQGQGHARGGGALNQRLASAIVRVVTDYVGRGPTRARAFYHHNVVVVILEDALTQAERSLAAAGKPGDVRNLRRQFQFTMQDEFVRVVEELTGCKVTAFMSDNNVDPDLAAEIFVLDRSVTDDGPVT
jgi:uncharacterized protein YbcI